MYFFKRKLEDARLNWLALAQPQQTVAIYMGVTGLEAIARELQAAGLAAATPAALVHRVTCPQQQVWFSTLADLPETARRHTIKPPALLVIGEVGKKTGNMKLIEKNYPIK